MKFSQPSSAKTAGFCQQVPVPQELHTRSAVFADRDMEKLQTQNIVNNPIGYNNLPLNLSKKLERLFTFRIDFTKLSISAS